MPRHILNDSRIRAAKPKHKPYRLADGDGLYLFVPPSGVRSWQLRYSLHGKQQTNTLGKLTVMTLAEARAAANDARKVVAKGLHLTVAKRVEQARRSVAADNTFRSVAADWVESEARSREWSAQYQREVEASLRNHLGSLDKLPMTEITAAIAASTLRKVGKSAPQMLEKVRYRLRSILDYAVEGAVITGNPLPATRKGPKVMRKKYPAVTNLKEVGAILRAQEAAESCKGVRRGHLLVAFTALRVGEVTPARWDEFNLAEMTWTVPRERMKRKDAQNRTHLVPLPPVLVEMLKEWHRMDRSSSPFVCPAPRDPSKHITPEAIEKHYREALSLGGKHSPHSWRSTFSTNANDAGHPKFLIERQLDHGDEDKVADRYNRAQLLELRRPVMNWYAAQLIAARDQTDTARN